MGLNLVVSRASRPCRVRCVWLNRDSSTTAPSARAGRRWYVNALLHRVLHTAEVLNHTAASVLLHPKKICAESQKHKGAESGLDTLNIFRKRRTFLCDFATFRTWRNPFCCGRIIRPRLEACTSRHGARTTPPLVYPSSRPAEGSAGFRRRSSPCLLYT